MERKLTTIVAADVVGYSKMMAANEEGTLNILRERREIVDAIINDHGGTIFGSAGDSVIAQFDSPVRATESAILFQNKLHAHNQLAPEDKRMVFRAGINIGDVMVAEDNLFGDAVNIAARLEAEARPGGICISKSVLEMIERKLKVSFEDAGELDLKNIDHPVTAYFVIPSKNDMRWSVEDDSPKVSVEKTEPGSLAVMLFKNLSKDEEQEYFCEGFSEDLISALSQFRKLVVISGNASFAYRETKKSPSKIGKELGIRYILEGSVRKMGPRLRINASLIATAEGKTVWSNKYDVQTDEIFDVQDELIETLVATIAGRVEADETQKISTARPDNLDAYDLVLKGLEFHKRGGITKENAEKAVEYFSKAIETDPNYARAYAWKACSTATVAQWDPERFGGNWLESCFDSVSHAMDIDPDDAEAHRILGAIRMFKGEFDASLNHHEKARDLCPSDAYIRFKYATVLIYVGDPEKALEEIQIAKRLDPFCPDYLLEDEGICYFWLNKFDEALESFRTLKVPSRNSLFYRTATLGKKGQQNDAKISLAEALSVTNLSISEFINTQFYKSEDTVSSLRMTLEDIAA